VWRYLHLVARHARLDLREIPLAHDLTDVLPAWSEPTVTMKVCLPSGPPGYSQTSEPSAFLRTGFGLARLRLDLLLVHPGGDRGYAGAAPEGGGEGCEVAARSVLGMISPQ